MEIIYFSYLDYRKVNIYNYKECGMTIDEELLEEMQTHPEWFEGIAPPRTEFPIIPTTQKSMEQLQLFPYSEAEINYLEMELKYKFPRAFRELLFLYGGEFFKYYNQGIPRIRVYSNGKKKPIEEDVQSLKQFQDTYKKRYKGIYKKNSPEDLFAVHLIDGFYICIISNKYESTPVFSGFGGDMTARLHLTELMTTLQLTPVWNFRQNMEYRFFTAYTSSHSASLLNTTLKNNKHFNEIVIKKESLGLELANNNKKNRIFILIEYDNMPAFHYKNLLNKYSVIHLFILAFHFKEVVNNREKVVEHIIETLQEIDFL